jgi:beta-D-xylosidase 4
MKPAETLAAGLVVLAGTASAKDPLVYPDCVNGLLKTNKVCDKTLTPGERAAALVAALQPSEKLQNIIR